MKNPPIIVTTNRVYWEKWLMHFSVFAIDESVVLSAEDGEVAYYLETDSTYFDEKATEEDMLRDVEPSPITLGYLTWWEKYSGVDSCNSYLPDKTLNASFHGSTRLSGQSYKQGECCFGPGEKVLMVSEPFDAVIPCVVLGKITPEHLRYEYEHYYRFSQSFEEYLKNQADGERESDRIAVRPLVRVKTSDGVCEMGPIELVHRVNIFPYRKFDV